MVLLEVLERGCSLEDFLIEMDRILRSKGFVIVRDYSLVIKYVYKYLNVLRWDDWVFEVELRDDFLSMNEERVLIVRKRLWRDRVVIS